MSAGLNAEVAEKVMGWTLADRKAMGWGDGPPVWITGEDPDDLNSKQPTFQDFRPTEKIAHAMQAIEASAKRCVYISIVSSDTGYYVESRAADLRLLDHEDSLTVDEVPAAICRCALAAVQAEVRDGE